MGKFGRREIKIKGTRELDIEEIHV